MIKHVSHTCDILRSITFIMTIESYYFLPHSVDANLLFKRRLTPTKCGYPPTVNLRSFIPNLFKTTLAICEGAQYKVIFSRHHVNPHHENYFNR
jgi:hypothetical protein